MFENLVFRRFSEELYCQTSNISRILVGHKIVDHSDVVGASLVEGKMFVPGLVLYSLSGKTSYRKISGRHEVARFGLKHCQSL